MQHNELADRLLGILAPLVPGRPVTLDLRLTDLGLESLPLTRVWFQLRKEFGVDVPVSWLRQCPDPATLLARIVEVRADGDGTGNATGPQDSVGTTELAGTTEHSGTREPAGTSELGGTSELNGTNELGGTREPVGADVAAVEPFGLTDLQQAYLVAKDPQFGGDPIGCHVYREIELPELDVEALQAAWWRVVDHHDMLRAVITPDGRQRVQAQVPRTPIAVGDLASAPAVRERLAQRRYAPGEWPMHTVEVSHAPGGPAVVHLSIDVLFIDGHGLGVILDDWSRCYHDPAHELVRPRLTVRDCLDDLAGRQRTPEYRRHLEHLAGELAGLPDGPQLAGPPGENPRRSALTGQLDRVQWQSLVRLAGQWQVSPTALVLTLFAESFGWQRESRPISLVLTSNHRSRLPAEADDLVGPFTSSLVLPLPDTLDRPLPDAVQHVHERLWASLDHAEVSGVAALRALRAKDRTAPAPSLPVVFTSMLDTGRAGADGFASRVGYAVSQTTGVALDHQMWEQDGELHLRWDVVTGQFAPGEVDDRFAVFVNSLRALGDEPVTHRALNELQQSYFVPRAFAGSSAWDGCQVYHSFEVDDLDLDRLEGAWLRLVDTYAALRTVVTHDGRLAETPHRPGHRQIPVLRLADLADPDTHLHDLRERMVGRAFPLGRGPQSDLRVTVDAAGVTVVHLTTDLTILDGRSIHYLVRELFRLYADPDAVPLPAADPEEYRRERVAAAAGPGNEARVEHWRERVAALHPGPQVLPAESRERRRFEGRVTGWQALKDRARAEGLGPDALLASAFAIALGTDHPAPFSLPAVRWTPGSARYRPGEFTALSWLTCADDGPDVWEQATGFQLVLAEDAAADQVSGLAELRRRVMRERRTGAFDLPVVYTGLLDLSAQQLPPGVRLGPWLTCTPDVALDCIAIDEGDELRFYWDTTPSQFPPARLEAMFGEYRTLIEGLVTDPLRWNHTDVDYPAEQQVHLLFAEQARVRPEEVALRWSAGTMTFADLNRWANRIAWALRAEGVGPQTPVGISVPRGPAMVAAVFGVLKAGGAYVPLEPSLPAERAAMILADAEIGLVVTGEDAGGWDVPAAVRRVPVEAAGRPEHDPEPVGTVDDTAYVIFTSGSTGKPKGVAVGHRSVLNLLNWCARTHQFGPQDVGLCVTSLGFDLSVFDVLGLLGYGASLYLADEVEQRDPHLLLDVLLREPITFWNSAPTTLNQLAPLFAGRMGEPGTDTLRLVYLSGDYTPLPLPDAVRELFAGARIVSLGGATEATVWSNWFEVATVDPAWRSIPYGRPIDNSRYYVLDEQQRPCPVGVEGDLYIAGDCLSLGYYRQPELTGRRFVPEPFAGGPDSRMYRTGDRASFFPDGVICFLGRADTQVKIRGFRVELAEVEHRLRSHPAVKDVVALAREDATGDRKLVAYVVAEAGLPPVAELRSFAARALPEYMVPNVVAFVDTFPATSNGKLDRDALPWPVPPGSTHRLAPQVRVDPVAEQVDTPALADEIAAIFAELLGLPEIDAEADIWDQGATSFTMVQVSGALQQRYGERVPVSVLLGDPTVAGIARALAELALGPAASVIKGTTGDPAPVRAAPVEPVPVEPVPVEPVPVEPVPVEPVQSVQSVPSDLVEVVSVEAVPPGPVDFFSAVEREAFKLARHDLRPAGGTAALALAAAPIADEHFGWRASRRDFGTGTVSHQQFSRMLGLLRETEVDGRRRRLYPSAGDTYSVQAYLHVRPGGVAGVVAGLYYYHPVEHVLHLIRSHPALDRSMHFVYNRPVYDRAGFELYLFGQDDAVQPLYGADSERFQLLEAGYLGQVLMFGQVACGVGLCPIGTLALETLREQLGLTGSHRYLHAFLGGPLAGEPVGPTPAGERPLFSTPPVQPPVLVSAQPVAPPSMPVSGSAAAPASVPSSAPVSVPVAVPAAAQTSVRGAAPVEVPEVIVVGAAGRFPGADDLDELWQNLVRGTRSLTAVPAGRREQFPASSPAGGYLADVELFDSLLFRVAPAEAATLDPQLRLLLHTVWECLDSAGHTAASLAGAGRVGVFCGAMWQDYQHVGADRARAGHPAVISATASEAANRISHFFDFDGPSLAVDTSCSSSLTALHLAVESLRRGECDSAVVAAANLLTHPYHLQLLADLGLLAEHTPDGAFDGTNAGWSPGEGVVAILLRARPAADRDGDTGLALIEATRVGHLGGAGRFGTPQAGRLARSITTALADAGLAPGDVDYVECAAAGATLADAAEIEALGEVFAGQAVAVGTVKPNIGHLEAAAGLSQLVKVLLQFRHGQLAPTVMSTHGNAALFWPDGVRPVTAPAAWPRDDRSRALVNAAGATGSYGHVVLRAVEPVPPAGPQAAASYVVPLSAPTPAQLATLAGRLDRQLAGDPALEPADVALTLQTGRTHLPARAVVVAASIAELRSGLAGLAGGGPAPVVADAELARWQAGATIDWSRYRPVGGRRVRLPSEPFESGRYRLEPEPAASAGSVTDRTGAYLVQVYAEVSGVPVDRLDPHAPLEHYGLSSQQVVTLNARLAADLGIDVPSTLFFSHRDLAGVGGELAALVGNPVPPTSPVDVTTPMAGAYPVDEDGRIAVVGLAGRYPQADDVDEFWQNLLAGRDLITDLPAGRRRPGRAEDLMIGGFLDDVAGFDPLFFGITPRDAASMDPQERLFLQTAWHALENAGWTRPALRERHGGRVGVFVGSMYNEYPFFGLGQKPVGSAIAGIANRVSYFLDLNGPSLTVDTMCSSSLSALHLAVAALRRGECEAALVGGVNLSLHPNKFAALRELGMASSDHRCRSFGAGGDGFVPGEGVGAVMLKPLARALADGDRIHAVVLGTAVNHDGKTNGYTVPNPVAQAAVVAQALRDARVGPADLGYVEAHGTGTSLGDPIEIDGLTRALGAGGAPGRYAIGSVKSAIGHLEAAAGIAGLTKVILQFRHGTLAPSLHAEELNPNIDWTRSPFRVQREMASWPEGLPRRAGISSFGAGGTNAHVVVEDFATPAAAPGSAGPQLVVLSARTDDQLRLLAARWVRMLDEKDDLRLVDLAWTAQVGREAMRERLAVVAADLKGLADALGRFLDGDLTGVLRGRAEAPAEPEPGPAASLEQMARHWVGGGTVAWARRHPVAGRIVDLPPYPFAAMPCWAPDLAAGTELSGAELTGAARSAAVQGTPDTINRVAAQPIPLLTRRWEATALTPPGPDLGGTVLCLTAGPHPGSPTALTEAFAPARLVTLHQGVDFDDVPSAVAATRTLLDRGPVTGLLDLSALAPAAGAEERDDGAWTARLAVLQQVVSARPRAGLRVLQVVGGLLGMPGPRPDLTGARLAGFVRSLGAEYPWLRSTVLDTDRPDLAAELHAVWSDTGPDGEICLRDGGPYRPVLEPAIEGPASWRPDPDRVYLVTGGTRGLGALTARHLVRRGARRLAVLGARPLPPRHEWAGGDLTPAEAEAVTNIEELERLGARVLTFTGAPARPAELARFLAGTRDSLGPIAGIVHCAGRSSLGPAPFVHKTIADIEHVLEPKGDGLDLLLRLTEADPLEFVVLFSSISAAGPALAAGVSDYAAANSYLDLLAVHLDRTGRPGVRSVNWPVWRETGGGTDRPDMATGLGVDALDDADGLAVLDRVLELPAGAVLLPRPGPADGFDPETFLRPPRPATTTRPATASGPATTTRPETTRPAVPAPAAEAGTEPPRWLVDVFVEALALPEAELEPDLGFDELGVESVLLAELVTRIEERTGRPMEPTAMLEHPTLRRLSAYLAASGPPVPDPHPVVTAPVPAPAANPASAPAVNPAQVPAVNPAPEVTPIPGPAQPPGRPDERIAVIGMACRFPGAPDLASFWRLLTGGGFAVTEVPAGRWDTDELYRPERSTGHSISKWGGFLEGLEDFDPEYFGMSEGEARNLDPAIRLTLEAAAGCLSEAGYTDLEVRGQDIGVFMGARMSGYRHRIGLESAATGLGGDQNFIAARVAHQFDLRGPALVVDSACSSALVGVQMAVRSLLAGESEMALAGGVEVLLDAEPYLEFSLARALSPRGRCATFDQDADGFVPGEGVGVLLLKPLARALADGDRVHAVIDAVAVGNDGHTMGLTTPNPVAQAQVVRRALARAGVRAEDVGLVEAHGTATMIGDPIELRALSNVFREDTDREGFCAIGSVKSNLGHLLSAAGIAGLIKVLLALEHAQRPPTLFCENPNPRFDFATSPFFPITELRDWPGRRVAGVSAFGLGGTNAHVIASAAPPAGPVRRAPLPAPVFHRRRLWWEEQATAPVPPGPEPAEPLVASVLTLQFHPTPMTSNGTYNGRADTATNGKV